MGDVVLRGAGRGQQSLQLEPIVGGGLRAKHRVVFAAVLMRALLEIAEHVVACRL